MRVGLIPLDERPANARYPRMIGAIAGVEVALPPSEALGSRRSPAPFGPLESWLHDEASHLDALVVSLETLGHGGLIPSRTTGEPLSNVLARLDALRDLRRLRPDLQLHGTTVVTRIPDADDATEEPPYWGRHGRALHRLSKALATGAPDRQELRRRLPVSVVGDFLRRRLRNHAANLAALELVADGTLDSLVLSSDDTSVDSLGSGERRWLEGWVANMNLADRVLVYPGADEVGCVAVARLANRRAGRVPRIATFYALPGGEDAVAPYEDGLVSLTVGRQILAVGGEPAESDPDLLLAVNPPDPAGGDWAIDPPELTIDSERRDRLAAFADEVARSVSRGVPVAVADVAYANGGDPLLLRMLDERSVLPGLAAYAGWNTAGNTIGTALAQGCAALLADGERGCEASERFLLHRFLEDWGYAAVVRGELRRRLRSSTGRSEPTEEALPEAAAYVEGRLGELLAGLPGYGGWRVRPGSVVFPWGRTFECDFELERKLERA